ncbi:hypothetical protein CF017_11490 [Citrobacter braakii]|uniref:WYL domain-containing protein n=1 Tax=Citrobacter braakii TaxID=57706 RepID=UPI000CDEDD85|nr:WYL domain-containing protein [Citrobacter braakii]POZ47227.1 hypothetical protein CF017_11490 [Citrobacter braakii]TCC72398.1 hypothetical protein EY917_12965 [Citrobacter braakii]
MEIIIPLLFLGLSLFSIVVYFKSPEKLILRGAKGIAAFLFSLAAFGAFLSGDYATSFPIAAIVLFLSIRRLKLTKTPHLPPIVEKATPVTVSKKPASKRQSSDWFKNISFEYTDSNGCLTNREVDVKEINEQYITGYCHTRRQLRTFRIDRIENSEVVVRDTGELINVYDWIVQLYEK